MTNSETNKSTPFTPLQMELAYVLLPLRFGPDFAELPLYNRLFNYWLGFWTDVLRQNGTTNKVNPADFLTFDYAGIFLAPNGDFAGFTLHRLINFHQEPAAFHPYLNSEFRSYALAYPSRVAMTVEYVTVDRNWRKDRTGLSLSQTMLRLSAELQRSFDAAVCFIKARQDVKVSESVLRLGGETLRADIEMHNTPVSYQVIPSQAWRAHPDQRIESLSAELWHRRQDFRFQTVKSVPFEKPTDHLNSSLKSNLDSNP